MRGAILLETRTTSPSSSRTLSGRSNGTKSVLMLKVERRGDAEADLVRRRTEGGGIRIRLVRVAEWKPVPDVPVLSFHVEPTNSPNGIEIGAGLCSMIGTARGCSIRKETSSNFGSISLPSIQLKRTRTPELSTVGTRAKARNRDGSQRWWLNP